MPTQNWTDVEAFRVLAMWKRRMVRSTRLNHAISKRRTYTGPEGTLKYRYDLAGELTSVTGARSESYGYDLNGNIGPRSHAPRAPRGNAVPDALRRHPEPFP